MAYLFLLLFLASLFGSETRATLVAPPENITTRIENKTPACPLTATFSTNTFRNASVLHISYLPSPFTAVAKNKRVPITCRLAVELDFPVQNYTVNIREAMFRFYVNTNYNDWANIDMRASWWRSRVMAHFTPISIPGPLSSAEEFTYNTTSETSACGYSWSRANVDLLTTFSLQETSPSSAIMSKRQKLERRDLPLNQTVIFGWETCRD